MRQGPSKAGGGRRGAEIGSSYSGKYRIKGDRDLKGACPLGEVICAAASAGRTQ